MTQHDPKRSLRMLEFIQSYSEAQGYGPSVREIAAGVGLSSNAAVDFHIRRLAYSGYIRRPPKGRARALTITAKGYEALGTL